MEQNRNWTGMCQKNLTIKGENSCKHILNTISCIVSSDRGFYKGTWDTDNNIIGDVQC